MTENHETQQIGDFDIAVIGMACRLPDALDTNSFWRNLASGVESISSFSEEELTANSVDPDLLKQSNYVAASAVIDDYDCFDAAFFGMTPRDAEVMDPQIRIFLETTWHALESAGYDPNLFPDPIGLFGGSSINTYWLNNIMTRPDIIRSLGVNQVRLLNASEFLVTRTAYKLGLRGPCVNVQTACSTSLVAIHLAAQSLLSGECGMALAGGVNVRAPHKAGYLFVEGMINSPDGHCRPFDASANGTVTGNGCALVALRRMSDAVESGDNILAVIKGSAVNNDGSDKIGFTAPSEGGQTAVIADACSVADIEPSTLTMIEAHGTGTPMGDPIEVGALNAILGQDGGTNSCALGSLKSNMGHLDAAAGVAGFIKTVLSLQHRQIPPSLHCENPNPELNLEKGPLFVNKSLRDWTTGPGIPRRAGVSSFGIGGTNAHIILQEAPNRKASKDSGSYLLPLSARSQQALQRMTVNLSNWLKVNADASMADMAFTLRNGRRTFPVRRVVEAKSREEALEKLNTPFAASAVSGQNPVFMFTGQGAQYPGMAKTLYEQSKDFRQYMDEQLGFLDAELGRTLKFLLIEASGEKAMAQITRTDMAQPALFILEYAMAQCLIKQGVKPSAMIGHSLGEFVAATLAGVFTLKDALSLVVNRGRLMQAQPTGGMLALGIVESEAEWFIDESTALAAVNSHNRCVLSGPDDALSELESQLPPNIAATRLATSHAFHSQMMDGALEPFKACFEGIHLSEPTIPIISNITGKWTTAEQAVSPQYWVDQLRQTVKFDQGLGTLLEKGESQFLELGPGRTLISLLKNHKAFKDEVSHLDTLPSAKEAESGSFTLNGFLARLWESGLLATLPEQSIGARISLPGYSFEKERYWIEPGKGELISGGAAAKRSSVDKWYYQPSWKRSPMRQTDADEDAKWLILCNDAQLEKAICGEMKNTTPTIAKWDETFGQDEQGRFFLNPSEPDHFAKLLDTMGDRPTRIIYAWPITEQTHDLESGLDLALFGLTHLIQALAKNGEGEVRMIVASNQVYEVIGNETLIPWKAISYGVAMTGPQEFSWMKCRLADVDVATTETARALIAELEDSRPEPVVAYRGSWRWLATMEPAFLAKEPVERRFKENGAYLITGGLSGVGLEIALYLHQTYRANLAIVSRRDSGSRETWGEHPDLNRLLEIPAKHLLILQADVTDPRAMETAVTKIRETFGGLNGVIHCAGRPGGRMILLQDRTQMLESMAAKVQGSLILEESTRELKPEFILLSSSINALTGGVGQVDYCAANVFQDALAQARPGTFTSINWDGWRQTGMRRKMDEDRLNRGEDPGGMTVTEGLTALETVLSTNNSRVAVSTENLEARMGTALTLNVQALGSERASEESGPSNRTRPNLPTPYVAPTHPEEIKIAELFANLIGIDKVGANDSFFDLGGDSLLATQLITRLRESFTRELPIADVFENPSPAGLFALMNTAEVQAEEEDRDRGEI